MVKASTARAPDHSSPLHSILVLIPMLLFVHLASNTSLYGTKTWKSHLFTTTVGIHTLRTTCCTLPTLPFCGTKTSKQSILTMQANSCPLHLHGQWWRSQQSALSSGVDVHGKHVCILMLIVLVPNCRLCTQSSKSSFCSTILQKQKCSSEHTL